MFSDKVIAFYKTLTLPTKLSDGIEVLNPYRNKLTITYTEDFYKKFYSDNNTRSIILGINPGRLGAGLTGIPFTDPIMLEQYCGIKNELLKKPELSSGFIYKMIEHYGGPEAFYSKYFVSAVCPLGFVKANKNINYYDDKNLTKKVEPFIVKTLKTQLNFGINKDVCFCLGEGKNFDFLQRLNNQHSFFKEIIPLAHPRFIMQYKRQKMNEFIARYVNVLNS